MADGRALLTAVLVGAAVLVGCSSGVQQPPAPSVEPPPAPSTLADRVRAVEAVVADDTGAAGPGLAVTIADDTGRRTVVRGLADRESGTPMRAGHQFKLAGVTVPMVAATVLQLSEDGLLSLDDTVATLAPGLLAHGDEITVAELLGHMSGLPEPVVDSLARPGIADEEAVLQVAGDPLDEEPGERFEYRNVNFILLGLLAERAAGEPLATVLRRRVFEPLGMDTARVAPERPPRPGLAHGYVGDEDVTDQDHSWVGGAGAVSASAEDVSAFVRGLFEGALVPLESVALMTRMHDLSFADWTGYGLGVARVHTDCGVAYGHSGGLPGYASEAWFDTSSGRSVVILVNGTGRAVAGTVDRVLEAALCDPS